MSVKCFGTEISEPSQRVIDGGDAIRSLQTLLICYHEQEDSPRSRDRNVCGSIKKRLASKQQSRSMEFVVCMFDYRIANSARTHVNTWRTWTLLSVQFFVPSRHIFFPRRSKKPGGQCRRRRRNASADNKTLRGGEGNGSAVGTSCVLVCESWIPGYCANIYLEKKNNEKERMKWSEKKTVIRARLIAANNDESVLWLSKAVVTWLIHNFCCFTCYHFCAIALLPFKFLSRLILNYEVRRELCIAWRHDVSFWLYQNEANIIVELVIYLSRTLSSNANQKCLFEFVVKCKSV